MSQSLVPNSTSQQELTRIFRMIQQQLADLRKGAASKASTGATDFNSTGRQTVVQNVSYIGPKGRRFVRVATPTLAFYETAHVECEFPNPAT